MQNPHEQIEVGFHAFVKGGDTEFGAIRSISPHGKQLTVYVENAGDFSVAIDAVSAVVSEKVIFDPAKLDARLTDAISHAHDAEDKNL
jgi:hypothetical protein